MSPLRPIALALPLVLLACGGGDPTGEAITGARFSAAWRWDGASSLPGDSGWETTNDLGYRIEVHEAWLVSYRASLVPCEPTSTAQLGRALVDLFGPRLAHAAHAEVADPSETSGVVLEPFSSPSSEARELWSVRFPPARYCRAHYLVGPASMNDLPEPTSLYLRGTVLAPTPGAQPAGFELQSDLANGKLSEIAPLSAPGGTVHLTIERSLGRLFDGVDFEAADDATDHGADEAAMGLRVVSNLMRYAQWRSEPPGSTSGAAAP